MAKKRLQKWLAFCLAVSMLMGTTAMAVDGTEHIENPDGTVTQQVTTTTTETDENGKPTVVVTIEKNINEELGNNVATDGTEVELDSTRTEIYVNNGTEEEPVIGDMESFVEDGTEFKDKLKEEDDGDEPGQPPVTVVLKPGETTNSAVIEGSVSIEGTEPNDESPNYDYTVNYETDRTVTANTSDITVKEELVEVDMEGLDIVKKSDAEGVYWYDEKPKNTGAKFNMIPNSAVEPGGTGYRWVPRYVRSNEEMPDWLKPYYTYNAETEEWTPNKRDPIHAKDKPIIETDDDFNFVFSQTGEESDYTILLEDGWRVNADANGNAYKFKVEKDENGNVIRDENGNPTYVLNGNSLIQDPEGEPYDIYAANLRVCDTEGNVYFAYCMDIDTGTVVGDTYVLENLDDATYFEGTEEEQEEAKAHVRAVATKGYWGTKEGTGSLKQIKADLIDFINNVDDFSFTYQDPDVILGNATEEEARSKTKSYSTATAEGKAELIALVERLNEGGALAVTNSAVWEFGRGNQDPTMAFNKNAWATDPEFNHAMLLYREYLISDQLKDQVAELDKATTIIDENTFLAQDGLQLVVGDKVADAEANKDDNKDNDIYNTELSFTMIVEPSTEKGDDLIVKLVDKEGNVIRTARLAGDASKDGDEFSALTKDGNTYTFKDLPLSENSEFTFDLKLEGYQNLEQGVYIYKSSTGNYEDAQTLVGIAEGEREVDVTTSFTVEFDVDEDNHIHADRYWHNEWIDNGDDDDDDTPKGDDDDDDDIITGDDDDDDTPKGDDDDDDDTPKGDDDDDDTVIGDDDVPKGEFPGDDDDDLDEIPEEDTPKTDISEEDVPLEELPEEDIPLADVPKTGDASILWFALSALSGVGLIGLNTGKKREDEE